MSYTGGGEPRSLKTGFVSAPYFNVFGVQAALGRTFAPGEDQPGSQKVVVLTHRVWMSQFGADAGIVGHSILLDGEPHPVIGVLPGAGEFDRQWNDIWVVGLGLVSARACSMVTPRFSLANALNSDNLWRDSRGLAGRQNSGIGQPHELGA